MKLLYITHRLPFGAGEAFVIPEVQALLQEGHEVLIVPRISRKRVIHGDAQVLLTRTRRLPGPINLAASTVAQVVREPGKAREVFGKLRHTNPRWRAILNARATAQGIWTGKVANAWGADHIHAHWSDLTATLAMAASAFSGIPWSFTAHRYDLVRNNLLAQKLRSARFGRFISKETLAIARSLVPPDAMARAVLLHMGVVLPGVPDRPPLPRPTPVVLCAARLVPVKGHIHLLDAAARLRQQGTVFECWLAGDGPEREFLTKRIGELGLTASVRLLGTLPHDELIRLYQEQKVDCVVLPSLDLGGGEHEGISVALMEAMAYGVPTIATSTGGLPELLGEGAGLLVPPADGEALAGALARVLGSVSLRSDLRRVGRQRIGEEFEIGAITRQLVRWLEGRPPLDRRHQRRTQYPERRVRPERRLARL